MHQDIIPWYCISFKITNLRLQPHLPGVNELMLLCHYLNQYRFIISDLMLHSPADNFTGFGIFVTKILMKTVSNIYSNYPRGQWVNCKLGRFFSHDVEWLNSNYIFVSWVIKHLLCKGLTQRWYQLISIWYKQVQHHKLQMPSVIGFQCTVECCYKKTPHSSPIRASYEVSFVDPAADWYSARVPVIIHTISYYIGPRYNSTQLYLYIYRYVFILLATVIFNLYFFN